MEAVWGQAARVGSGAMGAEGSRGGVVIVAARLIVRVAESDGPFHRCPQRGVNGGDRVSLDAVVAVVDGNGPEALLETRQRRRRAGVVHVVVRAAGGAGGLDGR